MSLTDISGNKIHFRAVSYRSSKCNVLLDWKWIILKLLTSSVLFWNGFRQPIGCHGVVFGFYGNAYQTPVLLEFLFDLLSSYSLLFALSEVEPKPKSTRRLLREKMAGGEEEKGKKWRGGEGRGGEERRGEDGLPLLAHPRLSLPCSLLPFLFSF